MYKCQGFGHLKRDCLRIEARKAVRKYTGFEWEITGTIQGQSEVCVLRCPSQFNSIPERLGEGVELGEITHVRGVGNEFQVYKADIQVEAGPVNKIVRAVIVPDMSTHRPLIGMDMGPKDMLKAIEHVMSFQKSEQVRAVTTRSQSKKEEEAELVAEQTRLS